MYPKRNSMGLDDIVLTDNERKEGYGNELVDPLPEKFKCAFCETLMRDPVQTFRGELACSYCYNKRRSDVNICPIDGESISPEQIFNDKGKSIEIGNLRCYCLYKAIGCLWQGVIAESKDHQCNCEFKPEKCVMCLKDMISANSEEHLRTCSALSKQSECIYKDAGCNYKVRDQNDLINHMEGNYLQHAILSKLLVNNLRTENKSMRDVITEQRTFMRDLEETHKNEVQSMSQKIQKLESSLSCMHNKSMKLFEDVENMSQAMQKLSENGTHVQTSNDIADDGSKQIQGLAKNISTISTNILDIDLRQQILENTTYGGRILWKIDKFKTRVQQALTGKVAALHSAPGFTTKYGYKFCGRLYLNGDGMGKCTHMSLFFVIMKSEYDNLLEWPFKGCVTFRLINQNDAGTSVTESFYPDSNSSSFQKPMKEMNVAAGFPLFIPKDELLNAGFVRDDSMFVEIMTT